MKHSFFFKFIPSRHGIAILVVAAAAGSTTAAFAWRSALYPEDWAPGFAGAENRFLHDFSYAGYKRGEAPIPDVAGPIFDVTKEPYSADPTGKNDSTGAIQKAIDDAGSKGGGVVFLPAGTFRVSPLEGNNYALGFFRSNVVLRGAGRDKTFLYNAEPLMREKSVIRVQTNPSSWWYDNFPVQSEISADLPEPTRSVPVKDASIFAPGDLVLIRGDLTEGFISEHGMEGLWRPGAKEPKPIVFCRRINKVDAAGGSIEIDVPTRYALKTRDRVRVLKIPDMISGVGLEDFAIGMRQSDKGSSGANDALAEGTAGYDAHFSHAAIFKDVEDCWIRRVSSYAPPENAGGFHLLSRGIMVERARSVTVEACDLRKPQFRGGGGNGYLYTLAGNDCLVRNCRAEAGRHNYTFQKMTSSGNAVVDCESVDGELPSDFHMWLSVANLIDNMTCDGDFLEAAYRNYGNPLHGVTSAENVFWNINGLRFPEGRQRIVHSEQFAKRGYVIGTRGPASRVSWSDFVEGQGTGDKLEPRSLYEDQLARRMEREKPGTARAP